MPGRNAKLQVMPFTTPATATWNRALAENPGPTRELFLTTIRREGSVKAAADHFGIPVRSMWRLISRDWLLRSGVRKIRRAT